MIGELHVPVGAGLLDFVTRHGFAGTHAEDHLVLDLPEPAGYRVLTWAGPVPERWLPHCTRMLGFMQHDAPTGETDHNAITFTADQVRAQQQRRLRQGYGLRTALVLTDGGEPANYSDVFLIGDEVV